MLHGTSNEAVALIAISIRTGIGILFTISGTKKILKISDFRAAIENYSLIPERMTHATAILICYCEAAAGAMLLIGVIQNLAAVAISILLICFTAAITINLLKGRRFDCGCGGTSPSPISWRHTRVNIALTACTMALTFTSSGISTTPQWPSTTPLYSAPPDSTLPTVLAATTVMLTIRTVLAARRSATASQ